MPQLYTTMEAPKFIFLFGLLVFLFSGVQSTTFTIRNNCPYTIWPATLTGGGTPQLSSTGFELPSGASSQPLTAPAKWSGRFWARTGCAADASGKFTCSSGDCMSGQVACNGAGAAATSPATLIELTLGGFGGQDFYDISLVDGFNLPVTLAPQGGAGGCASTSCPADVNAICPAELALKDAKGGVVACKSACSQFNQPQYCCSGSFASPTTCPPTKYSEVFKKSCPQAYSYAYDDKTSTFTCAGGPNYAVTFCP